MEVTTFGLAFVFYPTHHSCDFYPVKLNNGHHEHWLKLRII